MGYNRRTRKMLRTQRRKLRLIFQTKRKYKQTQKETGEKDIRDDEIIEETHEEDRTHDEFDQDSSISFDDDDEGSTASQEDNLEDWIEHVK